MKVIADSPIFNGNLPSVELYQNELRAYEKLIMRIAFKDYIRQLDDQSNYNWDIVKQYIKNIFHFSYGKKK